MGNRKCSARLRLLDIGTRVLRHTIESFMIDFACQCGQTFSMPQEKAGSEFQCPNCHRLVDVPTLNEMAGIKPDGTYRLDAEMGVVPAAAPDQMDRVVEAFGRD